MKTIRLTGLLLLIALGLLRPMNTFAISGPPPLTNLQIGFWDFDDTDWLTEDENLPLSYTNLSNPSDWDGHALKIDSSSPAWLQYNIVEDTGETNLTFAQGTIQLWFLPDWNSGHGPNDAGRLIDVGQYGTNSSSSWWSLYFNTNGTNLSFSSVSNGVFTNYLTVPVSWASNNWHLIDLAYANTGSQLYIDGQLVTNGAASLYQPSASVLTNGFYVGSDATGTQQMRGQMDNLATFNYAVDAGFAAEAWAEATNIGTGGDTNINNPAPNYGTNLFISRLSVVSNSLSFVVSNTLNVTYAIQTNSDLTTTNWANDGQYVIGSDATNWTSFAIAIPSTTNNLFFRLQSELSSDNSGIADWWEQRYFGTNDFDPDALDSAGDGYTIYQKYALGANPGTFYTPLAPQGLSAYYDGNTGEGMVSWQPAPGPVTGYTLEKTYRVLYFLSPQVQDFTLSATNASYADSLSGETVDPNTGGYDISYRVQASYAGGGSAWSAPVPLQIQSVSGAVVSTTNGTVYLDVAETPPGTVSLNLNLGYESQPGLNGSSQINLETNIPMSALSNGLFKLPSSMQPSTISYDGIEGYGINVQAVGTNGSVSAMIEIGNGVGFSPFYDGREQLKQNLIFQLRAASIEAPFNFEIQYNANENDGFGYYFGTYSYPSNYAYAGLLQFANPTTSFNHATVDPFMPFEENDLFRNFVYTSPADANINGDLNAATAFDAEDNGVDSVQPTSVPPEYYLQTNGLPFPALLATNTTQWLFYDQPSGVVTLDGLVNADWNQMTISMTNGLVNWFGLPYLRENVVYQNYDPNTGDPLGLVTNIIESGGTVDLSANYALDSVYAGGYENVYPEVAQPQFQLVDYYFANALPVWNSASNANVGPFVPGSPSFSPTNQSQVLITAVGNPQFQIAGYAKLQVTNSVYTGVYGYLGQYFEQAYQIDTNGNVTTNVTGFVTPYGNFFATQPGPIALTTMPDPDTGQQGTGVVYAVSLNVDKNHDGTMDLSWNGPDATSTNSPFVFWCNNNFDRWDDDFPFDTPEQDDQESADCEYTRGTPTPDGNYRYYDGSRVIPCTRDLEDFARLWVCGITSNLLAALPAGSTVALNWGDVGSPNTNNPTIDLFQAADADGGIGYLTNETTAGLQIESDYNPYIGRVGPGNSLVLNASQFANSWAGNHFIWCGVSNGIGGLNLTITDANSNVLGQTTVYIQIKDIKQMYERWTVGDEPSIPPTTNATLSTANLPAGMSSFQYPPPITNTTYILHVHGYNMPAWVKDRFAETEYKRLYWQGYQGRFGAFNWPTAANAVQFGGSESQAWLSGQGLLNKLKDLNQEYPGQVYLTVHSLGNVAAGEALRLAGTNQVANTYIAMQGAVSSHAYDPTTPEYTIPAIDDSGTPDCYANYWTNGAPSYFNASAGAGRYINFFNGGDWALSVAWLEFQNVKPSLSGFEFSDSSGTNVYYSIFGGQNTTFFTFPTDTYTLFANLIQSRSYALGEEYNVGGAFKSLGTNQQVELDAAPFNFGTQHIYHSGEFRSDNPQMWRFWNEVLIEAGIKEE